MGYALQEHGVPTIDKALCKGCGLCVRTCPDDVFQQQDREPPLVGNGMFLGCIACGHCMAVCPTGAIRVSGRGMKSDDRIDLPARDGQIKADALEALMTTRRSIRRFKPNEVPRDVLERIVRMASTAPMGIPPHEVGVVVFPNRAKVQAFAQEACDEFEKMRRFLNPLVLGVMRPFLGKYKYEAFHDFILPLLKMLPKTRKQGRDMFTYDAPAAILFHVGPMGDAADCAIIATYAMLAAESLGLGSCMLGTSVALTNSKATKARYGIPPENKVGMSLILGHPAVEFTSGIRRRLASVNWVQ